MHGPVGIVHERVVGVGVHHRARPGGLERAHVYKKMRSLGIQRPGAQSHDDEDDA